MHNLLSNKIIILLSILAFSAAQDVYGQVSARDNYNYLDFQRKSFYFGMTFGTNFPSFRLNQSKIFIGNDSIQVAEGRSNGGFNLNMVTNFKMGEFFDLRFTPGFAFSYRSFLFNDVDVKRTEAVFFELPFYVRYKSLPYKDKRIYAVGGLKYNFDVANNSNARKAETLIKISPHDFQWEVGVGMQFFYPYFIFSPEIKYGRGLGNILLYNGALNESKVLENVVSQVFTISLNFEG
jgi:hypothetical protein